MAAEAEEGVKSNMEFGSKRKHKVINVDDDQALEAMLNNYASEGWRAASVT